MFLKKVIGCDEIGPVALTTTKQKKNKHEEKEGVQQDPGKLKRTIRWESQDLNKLPVCLEGNLLCSKQMRERLILTSHGNRVQFIDVLKRRKGEQQQQENEDDEEEGRRTRKKRKRERREKGRRCTQKKKRKKRTNKDGEKANKGKGGRTGG